LTAPKSAAITKKQGLPIGYGTVLKPVSEIGNHLENQFTFENKVAGLILTKDDLNSINNSNDERSLLLGQHTGGRIAALAEAAGIEFSSFVADKMIYRKIDGEGLAQLKTMVSGLSPDGHTPEVALIMGNMGQDAFTEFAKSEIGYAHLSSGSQIQFDSHIADMNIGDAAGVGSLAVEAYVNWNKATTGDITKSSNMFGAMSNYSASPSFWLGSKIAQFGSWAIGGIVDNVDRSWITDNGPRLGVDRSRASFFMGIAELASGGELAYMAKAGIKGLRASGSLFKNVVPNRLADGTADITQLQKLKAQYRDYELNGTHLDRLDIANVNDYAPGFYRANPKDLRFTQSDGSPFFSDGRTVSDLVDSLRNNRVTPYQVGDPLQVVNVDGKLFSIDNRRLGAFNLAKADDVPVQLVSLDDPIVSQRFFDRFDSIDSEGWQMVWSTSKQRTDTQQLLLNFGKIKGVQLDK
jgi:hypothetical protein